MAAIDGRSPAKARTRALGLLDAVGLAPRPGASRTRSPAAGASA